MKSKKPVLYVISVLLVSALIVTICGCSFGAMNKSDDSDVIPEAGEWKATVKLSDLDEMIPFWARLLLSVVAGNTAFDVDLTLSADGTFSYLTNTETFEKTIADSTNTIIGFLLKNIDLSTIIKNALDGILPENVFGEDKDCFGDYVKGEDGVITCTTTQDKTIRFKYLGGYLVQLDDNNEQVLKFSKVEDTSGKISRK